MELGATEAVQRHVSRHVVERQAVTQRKLDFEHSRLVLGSQESEGGLTPLQAAMAERVCS